jgi:dihydroorotate dehydrogenase (fumarate)
MNLQTKYLGLNLRTPLVVSASPLSEEIDNIKRMEDHGASAVVLHSLFEEQIRSEQMEIEFAINAGTNISPEIQSVFPDLNDYKLSPDMYLEHIHQAKEVVDIPIIASLNGTTIGGWTKYAKKMQQAGADAIELNVYYIPTEFHTNVDQIENNYIEILKAVKSAVTIPVAVKLSPFFTNMAQMAKRLDDAGADGLVLFNRFYQPDIDLDYLEVKPHIELSTSFAMRLPMTWIGILKGKIKADLAGTRGIHTGKDALKMLMVGANVTMLCSVLLKHGVQHIKVLENEITDWLNEKEYESVHQLIGSMSQNKTADRSAYERALYMKALTDYKYGGQVNRL